VFLPHAHLGRVLFVFEALQIERVLVVLAFVFAEAHQLGRLLLFVFLRSRQVHRAPFFLQAHEFGRLLFPHRFHLILLGSREAVVTACRDRLQRLSAISFAAVCSGKSCGCPRHGKQLTFRSSRVKGVRSAEGIFTRTAGPSRHFVSRPSSSLPSARSE